jgi:outer membrane protein OmpA-like peptidoglycan-associated protein
MPAKTHSPQGSFSSQTRFGSSQSFVLVGDRRRSPWQWVALGGVGVLATALLGGFVFAYVRHTPPPAPNVRLVLAMNVTANEATPTTPPAEVITRAEELAAAGGGTFTVVSAAGSLGIQGPEVSLRIETDGAVESDATARDAAVVKRVTTAFNQARAVPPVGIGRSILSLMSTVADTLGDGENEVWLMSLGLATEAPEDTRILTATEPQQAAASIPDSSVARLPRTKVHVVLLSPAGPQPPLNPATDAWRRSYVAAELRRTGATLTSIEADNQPGQPIPGAPTAPPVPPIRVTTPPPPPNDGNLRVSLDTSALFAADSAEFLGSLDTIKRDLGPIVNAWKLNPMAVRVDVTGYCARFGPAPSATGLSQQRADKVAQVLRDLGVEVASSTGQGYDNPLPDSKHPQSSANRTVVVTAKTIRSKTR